MPKRYFSIKCSFFDTSVSVRVFLSLAVFVLTPNFIVFLKSRKVCGKQREVLCVEEGSGGNAVYSRTRFLERE